MSRLRKEEGLMKRIAKLLCLILLAATFYGCSSGNADAPADNEAHPDGWLFAHGKEANADLIDCQGCHGLDFAGSGNAVSCFDCHLEGPPFGIHPLAWLDALQDHQGFASSNSWTGCAADVCHGPTLEGGNFGPSCFNLLCHADTGGDPPAPASHGGGYLSPAAHGIDGKDNLVYCQNCHGRPLNDFLGGFVADLFPGATSEINDDGNCSGCHPDATAHPTNWTRNSNASDRTHAAAGNKQTTCVICHNLTIDTTPGNTTAGPFPGAPSCFSPEFTNANGITTGCHAGGPGIFHDVGQDWLLPAGHVAAALANSPPCFDCHSQTAAGGGTSPACQDCHTAGNPLTTANCASCHNVPPDSLGPQGNFQPNLAGKHSEHTSFTPATADCTACHRGGGTGSLSHYDRSDQTTPDYPAEVAFLAAYTAKTGGAANYDDIDQTCGNISCHGGQTTPDWTAGAISVADDCTSCHQLASVSDQYNSYSSGGHSTHAEIDGHADDLGFDPTCSACHDAAELPASGHFDRLDTAVVEGDPVATLETGLNYDNTTDPANPTCTTNIANCHPGITRIWGAGGAPHPVDDSYRASTEHGPDAKANQASCQTCHATPASGGPNPKFTVDIIQDKLASDWPARDENGKGCMKCHNAGTAHPSGAGFTEDVRWYDAAPDNDNVTHNNAGGNQAATLNVVCGLCHPGLGGPGTAGFACTFCHVSSPVGDAVGTCSSCHNDPPSGATAPNRRGRHNVDAHEETCSTCHTNNGPDGTASAALHFTFPSPAFKRADLRSIPGFTMEQVPNNVTCNGNCHGEPHTNESWY
jgi:predicted CxxxxCH...CXXCH cytochrome family protein